MFESMDACRERRILARHPGCRGNGLQDERAFDEPYGDGLPNFSIGIPYLGETHESDVGVGELRLIPEIEDVFTGTHARVDCGRATTLLPARLAIKTSLFVGDLLLLATYPRRARL